MDPLTWTGTLAFLNPLFAIALIALAAAIVIWMLLSIAAAGSRQVANADGSITLAGNPQAIASLGLRLAFIAVALIALAYLLLGLLLGSGAGIVGAISRQLLPTWTALALLFGLSVSFKRRLGLYGKLFDSPIGLIGFALVMFWVFTGIFAAMDLIATHDPLSQVSGMKNKLPGTPVRGAEAGEYGW